MPAVGSAVPVVRLDEICNCRGIFTAAVLLFIMPTATTRL